MILTDLDMGIVNKLKFLYLFHLFWSCFFFDKLMCKFIQKFLIINLGEAPSTGMQVGRSLPTNIVLMNAISAITQP